MRIIMLIDMDYFYVACEEIKRPELKTRPTIVGADPKGGKGRGVVMTCNYVARKYGIHSAMPISMAYKIKPDAEYLPTDFSYYEKKSAEVLSIIKEFADKVEQVSIDEFFVDVSQRVRSYEEAVSYAERIKSEINSRAKLPCSIGISYNKLLSKMVCDKAKPNGIRLIRENEAKAFLKDLKIEELYGVGRKTAEKLNSMGYATVSELASANMMDLMNEFGSFGVEMHNYANGIDESEVLENYEIKSISREYTFERNTSKDEEIIGSIKELSKDVSKEVNSKGFFFKVVTLKLRYADFTEHMKSKSIRSSNSLEDIIKTATDLYHANIDKSTKIRKIGVRVSGFTDYRSQKRLFG